MNFKFNKFQHMWKYMETCSIHGGLCSFVKLIKVKYFHVFDNLTRSQLLERFKCESKLKTAKE
jgi:hypothetical protein